jgi:thioredoxin reductase/predicted O-methyltransferase YrrM
MNETLPNPTAPVDVVVIGGGAAGLAGALQLARSRRSVIVIDAGDPRNAPASHMHGYLGHDGLPPGELLAVGRNEAERYGGRVRHGAATDVARSAAGFRVVLSDRDHIDGRRVLVATGLVDELPDIPGVAEQWGRGVVHCPYCHGWEVRDRRIAVIGTGHHTAHQAQLFRQLSGDVTIVVHGGDGPAWDVRGRLDVRGIGVVEGPVERVEIDGGSVVGLRLVDGSTVPADAVVVAPRMVARADMLAGLGIMSVPAPMDMGEMIETDARGETSVAGVYAAGNVSDIANQVLQAAAEGSRVGAMINFDLVEEDIDDAVFGAGDAAEDWDRRYVDRGERMWSGHVNGAFASEIADLAPGTALDVGCGEGADATWLAQRGWTVTAVDISEVAVERARQAAAGAGLDVDWIHADLMGQPPDGRYDLVFAQYPALPKDAEETAIRMLLDAVAPGGTLLIVGHSLEGVGGHHHGFDPSAYVQPHDVADHLGEGWTIEVNETRARHMPAGYDGPDRPDVVLRARRDG